MNAAVKSQRLPALDDPLRRLPILLPVAILMWFAMLYTFSLVLVETEPPPPELKPLEARIVEIPPPPPPGLAGGRQLAPAPPKQAAHPMPKKKTVAARPAPPKVEQPRFTETPSEAKASKPGEGMPSLGDTNAPEAAGPSNGASESDSGGIGSDREGARALYAPVPKIPDELRENAFKTVAVAHFTVGPDGAASVVLAKPTPNPRLNQILLATLKQWKFFPAMRDGNAVASEFDLKIPISVQ